MRPLATLLLISCTQLADDNHDHTFSPQEMQAPPPLEDELGLTVASAAPGEGLTLVATGAEPGETVHFLLHRGGLGDGPCPDALDGLCVGVPSPFARLTRTADAGGQATLSAIVPATLTPGEIVGAQAFAVRDGSAGASIGSVPSAFEILDSASPSCVDFSEDFERVGWPYAGWTSTTGSVASGTVSSGGFHGDYSLIDPNWAYYSAAHLIEPGTMITGTMRPGTGRLYIGFDSDAGGTRSFVLASNTGDIRFQDNPAYSYTELTTTLISWPDAWVDFVLVIDDEYTAHALLLDTTTGVELGTVTHTYDTPFSRGGLNLRGFGTTYLDQIEVFCP